MAVEFGEISISTASRRQVVDITGDIEAFVSRSGIANGLCVAFSLHSTTAIVVNEGEEGLKGDILRKIGEDYPQGAGWAHDDIDDNADAHLAGTALGPSVTLIIRDGRLIRGMWQRVLFIELDGPRTGRRIMLMAQG
jgi:secondary thiamine-phosphate synthase enzyme